MRRFSTRSGALFATLPLVLLLALPRLGAAQTYEVAADEEFDPPSAVRWGIGKNTVRITGATAFSTFDRALRISLQPQLELLVADRFGVRLAGDIPVYADSPSTVYQLYWDNLIHLLPYRSVDAFLGLGTGVSFLRVPHEDLGVSPVVTGLLGLNYHWRHPWTLGVEGRAVWWADPFGSGGDWMVSGAVQGGVVF